MPHNTLFPHRFYDGNGKSYTFYRPTERDAIRCALVWSRRMGIKLYRRRS